MYVYFRETKAEILADLSGGKGTRRDGRRRASRVKVNKPRRVSLSLSLSLSVSHSSMRARARARNFACRVRIIGTAGCTRALIMPV